MSRLALGPIKPPMYCAPRVKHPWHDADRSQIAEAVIILLMYTQETPSSDVRYELSLLRLRFFMAFLSFQGN
jgi:hypothetical protein